MENTNKILSKMEIVKGAVAGFAVGVIWELFIITPLISNLTLRSIIVALVVSGCGCGLAGGIISIGKKSKDKKSERGE